MIAGRSRIRATAVLAALSLVAPGCASPGVPATQAVRVETPGCAQASCELSNDRGSWQLPRTPGAVTLITSQVPLKVSCRTDDGAQGSAGTASTLPPVTGTGGVAGGVAGGAAVGVAFGATALAFIPVLGVIAVATGAVVGASAGTALESGQRSIRYPELISIPMTCMANGAKTAATTARGAPLGLEVRGLSRAQVREAGLGERSAVLVIGVAGSGRAAAAGLRSGDVILSTSGQDLNDAAELEERVLALAIGAPMTLRVWRDRQVLELVLTRQPAAR